MAPKSKKQVDEGFLDALIGDAGAAGLRSRKTPGMTTHAQLTQDLFIKDFVGDAISSLSAGISGGFINLGITSGPAKTTPGVQPTTPVQAGQQGRQMTPQQSAIANTQVARGIQPTGIKMSPQQQKVSQLQAQKLKAAQKPKPVPESTYDKLNAIFESIMEATGGQSVADYMTAWFGKYMRGVDWQPHQSTVQPLIASIESSITQDGGKIGGKTRDAIKKLAQVGFALSKTAGATPDGAQNATSGSQANTIDPKQLKAALEQLKKDDLAAYNNLVRSL